VRSEANDVKPSSLPKYRPRRRHTRTGLVHIGFGVEHSYEGPKMVFPCGLTLSTLALEKMPVDAVLTCLECVVFDTCEVFVE
jgi:hypothetical protein